MKKIISMVLCAVLCLLALAGCAEQDIGAYLPNYDDYRTEEKKLITLNLYIICDYIPEDKSSLNTVKQNFTARTEDEFKTAVNIVYVSADDYLDTIKDATNENADTRADIVLINSKEMMDYLTDSKRNLLVDLTEFYEGKTFGKLNAKISTPILDASKIGDKYYCVPNNHILGDYNGNNVIGDSGFEYLVIDGAVAREYHYASLNKLNSYTSVEEFMADGELGAVLEAAGKLNYNAQTGDIECTCAGENKCVEIKEGGIADKALFESQDKHCNIIKYPEVTAEQVFTSAFGITKWVADKARAMEIIYAINTNSVYRNMLQYGVENVHYTVDKDTGIVTRNMPDGPNQSKNVYLMNILYTGDLFAAAYCDEIGWTKTVADNGAKQNNPDKWD